jgi:hypothetical protein
MRVESGKWRTEGSLEVSNTVHLSVKNGQLNGTYLGMWIGVTAGFKDEGGGSRRRRCFN